MNYEETAPSGWRKLFTKVESHKSKILLGIFLAVGLFFGLRDLLFGIDDWQYRATAHGGGQVGTDYELIMVWVLIILVAFLFAYWLVHSVKDIRRGKPQVIDGQIKFDGRRKLGWLNLSFPLVLTLLIAAGIGLSEVASYEVSSIIGIIISLATFGFFIYYLVASIITMRTKLDKPGHGVFPLVATLFLSILFVPAMLGAGFLLTGESPFMGVGLGGTATRASLGGGGGIRPSMGVGVGGAGVRPSLGGSGSFAAPAARFDASESFSELGATVGGSQTIASFRSQIEQGYMPYAGSFTTEGLFSEYEFDMSFKNSCDQDFCAVYDTARASEMGVEKFLSDYIAIGLDSGLDTRDLERNTQEIVIVLDISSSMNSGIDSSGNFYGKKDRYQSKIGVATETLRGMVDQLDPQDQLGIVLYDGQSYIAKPMRKISRTRTNATKNHLRDLEPTRHQQANLSTAVNTAHTMLMENDKGTNIADKRIIVISGTPEGSNWNYYHSSQNPTQQQLKTFAKDGVYTSFIGVGNAGTATFAELANTPGSNYTIVSSAKDFNRTLAEGFESFITPLAFDLVVALDFPKNSKFTGISKLYGTTRYDWASGELIRIGTLFPSIQTDEGVRGGVVLAKLQRGSEANGHTDNGVTVRYSYIDRNGDRQGGTEYVDIGDKTEEYYDSLGIRKAIALGEYGYSMEQFLGQHQNYLSTPGNNQPLMVNNDRYSSLYGYMQKYFSDEISETGAFEMTKDMNILEELSKAPFRTKSDYPLIIGGLDPVPTPEPPTPKPVAQNPFIAPGLPVLPTTTFSSLSTTATTDLTPRIAMWWSKVNQHVNTSTGQWETDPDGYSGAKEDPLEYCKKWYPGTTRIQDNYSRETIRTWRSAGNSGEYGSSASTIACLR